MRIATKAGVGLVAVGAVLSMGMASASAITPDYSAISQTTGSKATYTTGNHHILVYDTLSDGDSAYVWWNPGTSHADHNRGETSGGVGTHISVPVTTDSSGVISFQACRDISGGPDNCGSWVTVAY